MALVQNIASPYTLLFAYQATTQSPVNPASYCSVSRTGPFHTVEELQSLPQRMRRNVKPNNGSA
jgi:hypothetical protein